MRVLPLKTLRHDEGFIYGSMHANLANLHHHGFPVADGFIVLPPEKEIHSLLKKHHIETDTDLEHRKNGLKQEFFLIPFHSEVSLIQDSGLDAKKVWQDLLERWFYELQSKITRGELKHQKSLTFSPQSVFISKDIQSVGIAYFDPKERRVIIDVEEGIDLTMDQIHSLDTLVIQANKKLLLPQIYHWIVEDGGRVSLTKLKPYTDKLTEHEKEVETFKQLKTIVHQKNSLKLFQDISNTYTVSSDADGFLITANRDDEEKTYFQLNEVASSFAHLPVLLKLSLLNHQDLESLRLQANVLLSLRNLKQHLNLQLVIPVQHSVDEIVQIKRELGSMGLSRKGSLKYWLEIGTAENILAIEDYSEVGIDGVLIDLDMMYQRLNGYETSEISIDQSKLKTLFDFLTPGIKVLHKKEITVFVKGQIAKTDEAINFAVQKGLHGIISNLGENEFITEHIQFVEKTHLSHL